MQLRHYPYTLELRHTFTVAVNSRTSTPAVMVEVERDGIVGYGEASLPPYLGETQDSVAAFLRQVDLARFGDPFRLAEILPAIDAIAPGNTAAKAAVDLALHDWIGKKLGAPWFRLWGLDPERAPLTSFTIGIDAPAVMAERTREAIAAGFQVLKVKLGRDPAADRALVTVIRGVTDVPLTVDANQGWRERGDALRTIEWLATQRVLLVEQPMPKEQWQDLVWLRQWSPLPLVADESVQRLADVAAAAEAFHGINIKLMKCTGLREAREMITLARGLGLKVMLGCMTETSCAISAAAQLSPLVDWADLDGAALIKNDLFDGATIVDGRVTLRDWPGIGVRKRERMPGP